MAKLIGPLFSETASGTLAGILNYRRQRKSNTVRKNPRPKQPRSPAQQGTWSMFQFLVTEWPQLSAAQQATWSAADIDPTRDNFRKYMKYNLDRWARFAFPSQEFPADETFGTINTAIFQVSGKTYYVQMAFALIPSLRDFWAFAVQRQKDTPPTIERNLTTFVFRPTVTGFLFADDHPPRPGTYHYKAIGFATKGKPFTITLGVTTATVQ